MKKLVILIAIAAILVVCWKSIRFVQTESLNLAAKAGDIDKIDVLLTRGAELNGHGLHGMTPLMSACEAGNLRSARYLIEIGADVNGHNGSGALAQYWWTPAEN